MSITIISDFNADPFARILQNQLTENVSTTAFDQVFQSLNRLKAGENISPASLVVWTRAEKMIPSFAQGLLFHEIDIAALDSEVDSFVDALISCAGNHKSIFVMSWVLPPDHRGLGIINQRPNVGLQYYINYMNMRLSDQLAAYTNIYLLDPTKFFFASNEGATAPTLNYLAKTPYSLPVFQAAAKEISSASAAIRGESRRVIVLDLDNTLWGGILGDVGKGGLRLGGHDHVGEAFADFQLNLKALSNRGVALAISSKNYEDNALDAITTHPEMKLRQNDFSAWRINWKDKAANIVELADELNLGLSSFTFIDDNPVERGRVREALPEVFVPDWPVDPTKYSKALFSLDCFDQPAVTEEDRKRTKMFVAERNRSQVRTELSHDDWLETIEMNVQVEPYNEMNQARIIQLLNKSNQFNACTRRITEEEFQDWTSNDDHRCLGFRVSDKYGEQGLCGVISLDATSGQVRIVDFVMSCRVMGRKVEEYMFATAVEYAMGKNKESVFVDFIETERNRPMQEFLSNSSLKNEQCQYIWDCSKVYVFPSHINKKAN